MRARAPQPHLRARFPPTPQYDCRVTRWYYSNEWTHNFLFLAFHLFYVGFYLQAAGSTHLGLPILAVAALPALARFRCIYVVSVSQLLQIYELDLLKYEQKQKQKQEQGT